MPYNIPNKRGRGRPRKIYVPVDQKFKSSDFMPLQTRLSASRAAELIEKQEALIRKSLTPKLTPKPDPDSAPVLAPTLAPASAPASAPAPSLQQFEMPQLKSQSISPTKLKVSRQSTSAASATTQHREEVKRPQLDSEEVRLRWNMHHANMTTAFPSLLRKEQYCDVTLVAEGKALKCHKLVLSSCSPYFEGILENVVPFQHPIIFMKDIQFEVLKALCEYMYVGEVNIKQSDLSLLLSVAESLKIKGLAQTPKAIIPAKPVRIEPRPSAQPQQIAPQRPQQQLQQIAPRFQQPTKQLQQNQSIQQKRKKPKFNDDITDPLELMEKTYEEVVDDSLHLSSKKSETVKKSATKKVTKRKYPIDIREPAPPVFMSRRGTRSRPNVKVPRYFNAFQEKTVKKRSEEQRIEKIEDSFEMDMDIIDVIKTEPEDIDYLSSYEENFEADQIEPQIEEPPLAPVQQKEKPQKNSKKSKSKGTPAVEEPQKSQVITEENGKTADENEGVTEGNEGVSQGNQRPEDAEVEPKTVEEMLKESEEAQQLNEGKSVKPVGGNHEEVTEKSGKVLENHGSEPGDTQDGTGIPINSGKPETDETPPGNPTEPPNIEKGGETEGVDNNRVEEN